MYLTDLPRAVKRRIFFVFDLSLVVVSLLLAFVLHDGALGFTQNALNAWPLFPATICASAGLILLFKLPHIKLHAMQNSAILRFAMVAMGLVASAGLTTLLLQLPAPYSVHLIFGTLFFMSSVALRALTLHLFLTLTARRRAWDPVAIYGAGDAGIQLGTALQQSGEMKPVAFVDDNPNLLNMIVVGVPVYAPDSLKELIRHHKIKYVLLAMPSIQKGRVEAIAQEVAQLGVEVQVLPSFVEMLSGVGLQASLRSMAPDALLGRDKVDLSQPEIAAAYAGRVVMVTGAGGSIGSELCRQLINCKPAKIVLFEQNEFALYSIATDLHPMAQPAGIPVSARLGSVTNSARVTRVVTDAQVDIILHAAAYKHVPLVEENALEGAANNVLGTQIVADVAAAAKIERFVLISTDKAVRPTNVMGATKRLAELVVQDRQSRSTQTKFSMVRFGNVLGSSGSVLPLFQKQVERGGPVTVTHPDVTRYFMTIPEAGRLVLLSGAYAQGGDVFALDMGKPQKIVDIARKVIALSGRPFKDPKTGKGEIAIEFTGLRPGEKLYEELLIDDDRLRATPHPKILRAEERALSQIEVAAMLRELSACIEDANLPRLHRLIESRVEGYQVQDKARAG